MRRKLKYLYVILGLIFTLGISYSLYAYYYKSDTYTLFGGKVGIRFQDNTQSYSLGNVQPMSDSDGNINGVKFKFTVFVSDVDYETSPGYVIRLLDGDELTGTRITDRALKYTLIKDQETLISNQVLTSSNIYSESITNVYQTQYEYELILWVGDHTVFTNSTCPLGKICYPTGTSLYFTKLLEVFETRLTPASCFTYTTSNSQVTLTGYNNSCGSTVNIPKRINGMNVVSATTQAFQNNTTIVNVTVPETFTTLPSNMFNNCTNLESAMILAPVAGSYGTFYGCTKLNYVYLAPGFSSIGDSMFNGCTSLTGIDLPDSVTTIGQYSFKGCTNFSFINFSDNITSIGDYAFQSCTSLLEVDLPESLTELKYRAFDKCSNLTVLKFPSSLNKMAGYVFADCSGIRAVYAPWTNPSGITYSGGAANIFVVGSSSTLLDFTNTTLYVPTGSTGNYSNAPWNAFPNKTGINF